MSSIAKRPRTFTGVVELEEGWWGLGRADEFATAEAFAAAFNAHMNLSADDRVQALDVERGWVRWVPSRYGRYDGYFMPAKGPGPGAFEAWIIPEP